MAAYRRCNIGLEVQTLIFPKGSFSKVEAKRWAAQKGFKHGSIEETGESYRLRQLPTKNFQKGSFRTISMGSSDVKAVVGCPKPRKETAMDTRRTGRTGTRRDHLRTPPGGKNVYRIMVRTQGEWLPDDREYPESAYPDAFKRAVERAKALANRNKHVRVEEHAYGADGRVTGRLVVYKPMRGAIALARPVRPMRDVSPTRKPETYTVRIHLSPMDEVYSASLHDADGRLVAIGRGMAAERAFAEAQRKAGIRGAYVIPRAERPMLGKRRVHFTMSMA